MSIRAMQKVWDHVDCSGGDLLVMLCLADHVASDKEMVAWPSIGLIAARCRMSERGAQKALRRLEARGLISIETGGGRHGTNVYRLHINPEPEFTVLEGQNPEPAFGGEHCSGVNSETQKGELCDTKPRTPVHPNLMNRKEPTPLTPHRGNGRGSDRVTSLSAKRRELVKAFERFWAIYPRRIGKKAARERFIRTVQRGEATAEQLITGAERFAAQMRREERPLDKIAHPTTWLNQGRWEDDFGGQAGEDPTAGMTAEERDRWQRMVAERKQAGVA